MSYIDDLINQAAKTIPALCTSGMNFPIPFVPKESHKSWGLGFKAKRLAMGPRILHGACDLLAPVGTVVYAVDDGVVIRHPYHFYLGPDVYAIEIQHTCFTVRYGEVDRKSILVKSGESVKKGQPIAKVGKVGKGSMLHFEMYSGRETGGLTVVPKPPFNRRADLMNPEPFLDVWQANLPTG